MPLKKESSSVSLPTDGVKDQHPLKRKQPLSFDATASEAKLSGDVTKNRLIRSNDLLTQTPTEVLLDLLKAYAGVKECAEETQVHLYMVRLFLAMPYHEKLVSKVSRKQMESEIVVSDKLNCCLTKCSLTNCQILLQPLFTNFNPSFPIQILSELYTRVKDTKGSWRGAILGSLYGLVECSSPKILLAVARVVLALGVTGSNLTGEFWG